MDAHPTATMEATSSEPGSSHSSTTEAATHVAVAAVERSDRMIVEFMSDRNRT